MTLVPGFHERVCALLDRVIYKPERNYKFMITNSPEDVFYTNRAEVELRTERPDTFTGEFGTGYGGRRYLTPDMTDSQIVRTLFGACIAYEEHEVREAFQFDGKRIFGPHISIDALASIADEIEKRA